MEGRLPAFKYWQRLQKARRWAEKIIRFPYVRQVSLTGSLATGQATKNSDIDLFIQVKEGNLWWVRLAVTIWIQLVGVRRTDRSVANQLCLNWFATFDGPVKARRPHVRLAQRLGRSFLERLLQPVGPLLEFLARNLQYHRFVNDPRSHRPGSQVRFSDAELGFHPTKYTPS